MDLRNLRGAFAENCRKTLATRPVLSYNTLMKIGIYYNPKQAERAAAEQFAQKIAARGHEAQIFSCVDEVSRVDRLVVFGGDGTMLRAAKRASETDTPLFGVNFGTLGFLTEFERDERDAALALALDEHCPRIQRAMLEVQLNGNKAYCLNELALLRAVSPESDNHVVKISVTIDGSSAGEFVADGLIVTTPTGSTAYSLSAGGSIMTPDCETFQLTPVCAFSMRSRPIAYPNRSELAFSLPRGSLVLYRDGVFMGKAGEGDLLTVRKAERCAVFLTRGPGEYFRRLTEKIN